MPRYANRRDKNESNLRNAAERCGAVWIQHGPWDAWVWIPRWGTYLPVEVKDPAKQGHANEFTASQKKMREEWQQRGMKLLIWRTTADVIRDLGGRI